MGQLDLGPNHYNKVKCVTSPDSQGIIVRERQSKLIERERKIGRDNMC